MPIGVNLTLAWRLKPQLHETLPAYRAMLLRTMLRKALRVAHHAGFKNLDFPISPRRRTTLAFGNGYAEREGFAYVFIAATSSR